MLRFGILILFSFFSTVVPLLAVEHKGPKSLTPGWVDSFESDIPSWQLLLRENRTMVLKRERIQNESHNGKGSEKWQFVISKKTDIFLGHAIDFPWVIEELSPTLWVKSDRPGLVLGAQIVLPRTLNPETGRPLTFLVAGSKYTDVGDWQSLHFNDAEGNPGLFRNVVQTAKMLRGEFDVKFDSRDMYVRQLILFVEGIPNSNGRPANQNIWIDDLQIVGHAPVWSILPNEIAKLEPEYAAYQYALKELADGSPQHIRADREQASFVAEKERSENPEAVPDFADFASAEIRKNGKTAAASKIKRIEVVNGLNDHQLDNDPIAKLKTTGIRPCFDPINMGGFLANAVSEPVFAAYASINDSGRAVWEHSVLIGRPKNESNIKKEPNRDFMLMSGTGPTRNSDSGNQPQNPALSELSPPTPPGGTLYQPMRLSDSNTYQPYLSPNGAEASTTVLYAGTETALADQRAKIKNTRIAGQAIRVRDPERAKETAIGVRAIEYRGEPLAFLHQLKFNAVWLSTPPTPELLEEANQVDIWLICPPPIPAGSADAGRNLPPTGSNYDCVLVWNLGEHLVQRDYQQIDQLARDLKSADNRNRRNRPFVCSVDSGLVDFSRIQDMLILARREPLLSTLDLQEYDYWLRDFPKMALPSTPRWGSVQTQPDAKLIAQWDLFGGHREQPIIISFDQIRLLVRQNIARGAHGILFLSQTPLNEDNPETLYRAKSLALINMELMLIEEWFAEGVVEQQVNSNQPHLSAVLVRRDKAKLLLPLWNEPNSQYALGQAATDKKATFLLPGVPETYDARLLIPGVLEPIKADRIAGGTRLELADASLNSLVFLTEEGAIRGKIEERADKFGETMSRLALELTEMRLVSDEKTLLSLKQASDSKTIPVWANDGRPLVNIYEQETLLNMTRKSLDLAKDLFERKDYSHAYLQAEWATRGLRNAEREMWVETVRPDINRSMTPVSTCFATIPSYISTFNSLRFAQLGQNLLLYGDFECNLETWIGIGWRHEQHRVKDVEAEALLVPDSVHSGSRCLQLMVKSTKPEGSAIHVETAPIWITTPSIPVSAGQLICVSGWINIPQKLLGSVDGMMIRDSIGGDALALRFDKTDGWREFVFYRYAPAEGVFETSFLLTGVGKALIDDVTVRPVVFGTAPVPVPTETPAPPPSRRNPLELLNPFQLLPGRQ